MIKTLLVATRDRGRLAEIAQISSRFGLGVLMARWGFAPGEEGDAADAQAQPMPQSQPQRTRLALEALGPTFVKLGQILATRGDLLSAEWIAQLEQLHSQAPTIPFELLRGEVEEALGGPPEAIFASFDTQPLAAASMAQVHRATLADGRVVVLKIRRPGIRPRMEADLRLIAQCAALAESASAEVRRFAPVAMVSQLAQAVLNVARYDVFKLSEAVLAGAAGRVLRMLEGLQAEGEAEVLVHYTLAEDIRSLKRVKDAMAQGRPLPMALRENRVWGAKERLFERVLPRLSEAALSGFLADAHTVDGIVKGLRQPNWPASGWAALQQLALALCHACANPAKASSLAQRTR